MNKIQRLLLVFFAIMVLFSGTYYSQSNTHLQLFLAATLLFFGLSPRSWFRRKKLVKQGLTPISEQIQEIIEDEKSTSLPTVGFPTPEKLLILNSLIKLRSAEVGSIYRELRWYQKTAGDGNWVPLFMKRRAVLDLQGPYTHVEKEEEEKAEAEAVSIFEQRYKFCSIAPIDLYEDQIADLQVALSFWCYAPQTIINRLQELQSFGILGSWITALIKEYQIINEIGGSFKSIFNKDETGSFKHSLDKISLLWSEITRLLKMSMFLNQIQNKVPNEKQVENIDLQEIEALIEVDRHLDCAIAQENLDPQSHFSLPSKEKEAFFLDRLKFNPLWYNYS